ncbi:MAG TPA: Fur family transcriptional regulator [Candidatus Dormibacteraeota bacterium]
MPAGTPPLAPGMRQTRQRRLVWDAVGRLGGHCTADEIAAEVEKERPGFPRSTVYRALDALTGSGALHAVRLGDGPIHYEVAGEAHQHAICQVCEGVFHIEHDLVHDLEDHLERLHRFHPVRTEVLVVGVCDACARGRPAARAQRTARHRHYA